VYAFIILTSTLVPGINYFVIITRPLHPIPVRKRSSSSCYIIDIRHMVRRAVRRDPGIFILISDLEKLRTETKAGNNEEQKKLSTTSLNNRNEMTTTTSKNHTLIHIY